MPRLSPNSKLVIASNNAGKVKEIGELLAPLGLEVISVSSFQLPEPEESGATFAANSEIKAIETAKATGLPALADDSGLAVDALDGAPGIYSARWAGPDKDFSLAMEKIHAELKAKNIADIDYKASFICDLCLAFPDGSTSHYEGSVSGTLSFPPRGSHGFGYDPIFIPNGYSQTFAEIPQAEKQQLSHRANAFQAFLNELTIA